MELAEFEQLLSRALHACGATRRALVHLSDESGALAPAYQLWPLVVRHYWHQGTLERWGYDRVLWVPLGYTSGFWGKRSGHPEYQVSVENEGDLPAASTETPGTHAMPPASRGLHWAFVGNGQKGLRPEMLATWAKALPAYVVHSSSGFLAPGPGTLSSSRHRELLEQAIFCPCPCGYQHPDTFRFAEALEAGCLPVVADKFDHQTDIWGAKADDAGYFDAYAAYAYRAFRGAPPPPAKGNFPVAATAGDWASQAGLAANALKTAQLPNAAELGTAAHDAASRVQARAELELEVRQLELTSWWGQLKMRIGDEIGARLKAALDT